MWWDEETDGELMYPHEQKYPTAEEVVQLADVQSRRVGRPQQPVRPGVPGEPDRPEHAGQAHAVRRLPRPRLGLPRRLPPGPQGQLPRPRRQRHPARRQRRAAGGDALPGAAAGRAQARAGRAGPPDGHPPGKGHALRRLPFRPGRARQHPACRTRCAPAVEIQCIDCHGTVSKRATLRTTGPASYTSSPEGGRDLAALRTPSGKRRFERARRQDLSRTRWSRRTCAGRSCRRRTPSPRATTHYNAKSALAKTVRFEARRQDGLGRRCPKDGEVPVRPRQREHELHRLPLVVEPELLTAATCRRRPTRSCRSCTTRAT